MDETNLSYQVVAYYGALLATLVGSIGLACLLWWKAGQRQGITPLIWFCLGTGMWAGGHLLIHLGSDSFSSFGQGVANLFPPLVAACLVHFSLVFSGTSHSMLSLGVIYASAAVVGGSGALLQAGRVEPWLVFPRFYHLDGWAWVIGGVTVTYSVVAQTIMAMNIWRGTDSLKRRQFIAVVIATGGGLSSVSGLLFPVLGLSWFPYPMLLLPGYSLILVYGILRYEFMDVNIWARRSLTVTLLVLGLLLAMSGVVTILASLGFTGLGTLPSWQLWLFTLIVLCIASLLQDPVSRLATRLVYPGTRVNGMLFENWRHALDQVQSWDTLTAKASILLSEHFHQPVQVRVDSLSEQKKGGQLEISCRKDNTGWVGQLNGWEGATPAIRNTGEVFSALLANAASRLDQSFQIVERERQMVEESHFAELGRLSATVAHELRNPLNIIGMATTKCQPHLKREILSQVQRADQLTEELLTYTGHMSIHKGDMNVKEQVKYVVANSQLDGIAIVSTISNSLVLFADPHRVQQALFNLVENAKGALKGQPDGKIEIMAEDHQDVVSIVISDNGPGISPSLHDNLFRAYVSGRPGGHGLGLAIVRRIMEAHGGTIRVITRHEWSCCMELRFPHEVKT